MMIIKRFALAGFIAVVMAMVPPAAMADTEMYFIRHADVDLKSKEKPLTEAGKKRAMALVGAMSGKPLTHILVTDYPRTIDTATPLSKDRGLDIKVIHYKGKKAIGPMASALKGISDGSGVLIVANSGNLFAIMSAMGVHTNDSMPCDSRKCFDSNAFDNIWHVTVSGGNVTMKGSKY